MSDDEREAVQRSHVIIKVNAKETKVIYDIIFVNHPLRTYPKVVN